jgi:hypothetical protein
MGQDAKAYIWVGYNLERDSEIYELLEEKLHEMFDEDGPLGYLEDDDSEYIVKKYGLTAEPEFFDNDGDYYGFGFGVYHHDWDFGPADLKQEVVVADKHFLAEANMRKLAHALSLPVDKISMWIQTDYR